MIMNLPQYRGQSVKNFVYEAMNLWKSCRFWILTKIPVPSLYSTSLKHFYINSTLLYFFEIRIDWRQPCWLSGEECFPLLWPIKLNSKVMLSVEEDQKQAKQATIGCVILTLPKVIGRWKWLTHVKFDKIAGISAWLSKKL